MKKMILMVALFTVMLQPAVMAAEENANLESLTSPAEKFGRGVTNVLTSPGEVLYQPMKMYHEDNNFMISWVGGLPLGVVHFPVRLVQGLYEIVTFPWDDSKQDPIFIDHQTLFERFDEL